MDLGTYKFAGHFEKRQQIFWYRKEVVLYKSLLATFKSKSLWYILISEKVVVSKETN